MAAESGNRRLDITHAARSAWRSLGAYRANPDPATAAANTLAVVLAYNGPCFPVYLYLLIGRACWPSLIELWTIPFLVMVPWLSRRHSLAGRLLLAIISTLNTILFVLLFGARAELQLFMLPCISLGLLFYRRERLLALAVAGVPLLAFVALRHHEHAIRSFTDAQYAGMAGLSEVSVATLTWFMVILFGAMLSPDAKDQG